MTDARRLHDHALVIDALVYHTDGWTGDLRAGGIDALNVTVCHFEADFEEACQHIAIWHSILGAPESEWRCLPPAWMPSAKPRLKQEQLQALRRRSRFAIATTLRAGDHVSY